MKLAEFIFQQVTSHLDDVHRRSQRVAALRRRKDWRKADVAKLLEYDLPNWAMPRLNQLAKSTGRGRGVVKSFVTLDQRAEEVLRGIILWFDRDTPPHERVKFYQKSRWFPELLEAAYRGELETIKRQVASGFVTLPARQRPYELAEERVARVAGISPATVRQHCNQVRKDYGGHVPNPPTSADTLKLHLEKGLRYLLEKKSA